MLNFTEPKSGFRIDALHRLALGGRWRVEAMRSYTRPVLIWFTRGQGRITVAGRTRGYGPHNAVFLPAGTMHGFDMVGQVIGSILHFPRESASELPDEPMHLRLRDAQSQAELTAMIDAMERELKQGLPGMEQALLHHAGLMAVWLERRADFADTALNAEVSGASDRLARAFSALVERDFRRGKTVAAYAADLGVTPTHLSRACRETSGRSAGRIVQDRVHYEARKLLSDTAMPVNDIAASLGFRSAAYFTRAFQSKTGKTPTAFRRRA
jgi:AraC-like DNA-binding protein